MDKLQNAVFKKNQNYHEELKTQTCNTEKESAVAFRRSIIFRA